MSGNFFDTDDLKRETRKIVSKILIILKEFKPALLFICFVLFCFKMKGIYNGRFKVNKITAIVKKSKYVSNAILLRDNYFLTTAIDIATVCQKTKLDDNIFYYLVMNNTYYKLSIFTYDLKDNLAIVRVENSPYYSKFYTKNFVMFTPEKDINMIGKNVFVSKSLNNPNNFFFQKYKINSIGNFGLVAKSFDNVRKNTGEIVLDDRLELVGITAGNSTNGIFSKFKNELEVVDVNKIRAFLRKNRLYYFENKQNIDLYQVKNYLKSITGRIICYVDVVPERLFITIER